MYNLQKERLKLKLDFNVFLCILLGDGDLDCFPLMGDAERPIREMPNVRRRAEYSAPNLYSTSRLSCSVLANSEFQKAIVSNSYFQEDFF